MRKGIWISIDKWTNNTLSPMEKIILWELEDLDDGDGVKVTNKYLSELIGISANRMAHVIMELRQKGLLVESGETKNRVLRVICSTPAKIEEKKIEKPVEPDDSKINWENAKSDLQRLMNWYIKAFCPTMYEVGLKSQVGAFYKQYGRIFSMLLGTAGSLDVAIKAFELFANHYNKEGWAWNLGTVNRNWAEFVGEAMQRINAGKEAQNGNVERQ